MKVTYVGNAAKKERGIDVTYTGGSAQKTGRVKATYVGGTQSKAVYDAEAKTREARQNAAETQKSTGREVGNISALGAGNYGADKRPNSGYNYGKGALKSVGMGLTAIARTPTTILAQGERLAAKGWNALLGDVAPMSERGLFNMADEAIAKDQNYLQQKYAENTAKGGKYAAKGEELAASAVEALTSLAAAYATSGASAAMTAEKMAAQTSGKSAPAIVQTLQQVVKSRGKDPNYLTSAAQIYAHSYNDAKAEGVDEKRATLYALGNALLGSEIEISGGIQNLPNRVANQAAWRTLVDTMIDEGKEEVLQGVIDRTLQNVVYDAGNQYFGVNENAIFDPGTAAEEFAGGAIVGGLLSGGVTGINTLANRAAYNAEKAQYNRDVRQNTAPEMDSKAAQAVDAVTRGESITGNQAAAIAKNPVAVETLEANTGVKLNTQQPISQLKRDIAALASRDTTQTQSQGTTATPVTQRRAQKPTGGFLEAGQKAYQEMSRTAEDVPTLYAGFSSVYNAGLNGIEASKAKGAYAAMLTPEQRYAAYNAGLEDAAAQVARENAEVKSVTTTAGAGLADNVYSRAVIAKSKHTAATLNAMGKKLGVRIEFVDSVMGGQANGQYIRDKSLIQIAVDSNKPYLNVAAHEVTHRMQDLSPAEYRKFRQAAMEHRMREKGIDEMAEVVEWYREKAESAGVTLTQDEVMDEIAADFAGDMLDDIDLFERFAKDNRTVAQKLLDSLKEFIAKVKAIFTGKARDKAAQEAYGKDFAELEDIAKQWQAVFDAAERQAEKTKTAAGEGDGAKYQIKQFPNGMKYVQADRQVLFGNDPKAWSEQLESYINGKIRNHEDVRLIAEDGDILLLTSKSAGKLSSIYDNNGRTLDEKAFERKANAAAHIDELIKVSERGGKTVLDFGGRHGDMAKDGWNYRTAYFMDFDGKYYRTRISVALGKDGSIVYNIGEMQERSTPQINGSSGNSGAQRGNASGTSILTDGENVKPQFSLKAPVEETKNLLALHNLTEKNLLDAAKLGGLPMPSIAIVKADEGHGEYGDISFVFSKDTIDPQLFRSNKVYGYDAWTPTAPRIEYEVNEKSAKKIHDLFYRMERAKGRRFADPLYSAANTLEDELNRKGGVDKVVGAMRDDPRVMNIYLEDTGRGAVENVMKREVTRMDDNQQEMASFLIRELGESTVNDFRAKGGESPIAARKLWYKEHGEALNAALQKYYEKLGLPAKDAANVVNAETFAAKMRYMLDTRKYLAGNTETVTEEVDRDATNKAIHDKVNQKEYEQWLDDLFDGVVKNEGIYNGKDYYTSSGNRRSFSATHYEITLENIVKAMKQGDQKGANTFFGGQAIWGVASKDYGSIDEIKADSGRLQKMTEEEYSAIRQKYSERLAELTNEIKDPAARNEFIASDDAASAIVETLRTKRTVAGIDKELRTYPTLQIKPDTAEKVLQLYEDISNMPTGYFEAKPQRAVGFDEVLAAVIPNDASAEVKAALENTGVRMIEYTSGDEKALILTEPMS